MTGKIGHTRPFNQGASRGVLILLPKELEDERDDARRQVHLVTNARLDAFRSRGRVCELTWSLYSRAVLGKAIRRQPKRKLHFGVSRFPRRRNHFSRPAIYHGEPRSRSLHARRGRAFLSGHTRPSCITHEKSRVIRKTSLRILSSTSTAHTFFTRVSVSIIFNIPVR